MTGLLLLFASIASNILAFLVADRFLQGFALTADFRELIVAGFVYAVLNLLLRPVLKVILSPLIILTLGLGLILVNALILYLLTILTTGITIDSTITLLYATLLIGAVNLIINFGAKALLKN